MQTENQDDTKIYTTTGAVLLGLRGVEDPGLTEQDLWARLESLGVPINRSSLYKALSSLEGAPGSASQLLQRRTRREPGWKKARSSWFLTEAGERAAAAVAESSLRLVRHAAENTVDDHARHVLALRAELAASEDRLKVRIGLGQKVVLDEGTFTVKAGALRGDTAGLEKELRDLALYEEASVERRKVVLAKVEELAASHPALGAWIDAKRQELAEERHLQFTKRKGE